MRPRDPADSSSPALMLQTSLHLTYVGAEIRFCIFRIQVLYQLGHLLSPEGHTSLSCVCMCICMCVSVSLCALPLLSLLLHLPASLPNHTFSVMTPSPTSGQSNRISQPGAESPESVARINLLFSGILSRPWAGCVAYPRSQGRR